MLNNIISLGDPCVGDSLAGYLPGVVSTILSRMITLNVIKRTKNNNFIQHLSYLFVFSLRMFLFFVRFITFSVIMRDRIVLTSPGRYPANESPTHGSPRDIIVFSILAICLSFL
jgi:hypothetical protein